MLVGSEESSTWLCCTLKWVPLLVCRETLYSPPLQKVPETNDAGRGDRNSHIRILNSGFHWLKTRAT